MAQQIIETPGSIFGRLGSGLGKGLAEQLPKEVERSRLSSGLKQFEQESGNLNPMQQLARLSAIPGITPQMIQSFGELGRQQLRGQALGEGGNQNKTSIFDQPTAKPGEQTSNEAPSLTNADTFAKAQEGYIPMTEQEKYDFAGDEFRNNPAKFNNDPEKALAYAKDVDLTNQKISEAHQKKHKDLTDIQDNVVGRLDSHYNKLGAKVPANVYSKIEDKAIQDTKPKKDGGGGLNEQQAMKKYGKELDEISRDYESINTLGNWGIVGKKSSETLNSMNALQKKFEKNDDTKNFADKLISVNKLSPSMAYSIAEPVAREKELNSELSKVKPIKKVIGLKFGRLPFTPVIPEIKEQETLKLSKKLAPLLGKKGSPLAVAHELEQLGYDPGVWMKYLNDNLETLNPSVAQADQITKPDSLTGTFNDWWLSSWSGINRGE